MRRVGAAISLALLFAAIASIDVPALAENVTCYFDGYQLVCKGTGPAATEPAPPGPGQPISADSGPNPSRFEWRTTQVGGYCIDGQIFGPYAPPAVPAPGQVVGT